MSLTGRKIMVTVLCMYIDAQKLHTLNQENTNPNHVFEATRGTLVPTKKHQRLSTLKDLIHNFFFISTDQIFKFL